MRILLYNWRDLKHPLAGGAEVYSDTVATEWVKMGHSVTLFCAAVEGECKREVSVNGYEIVRRGSRHGVYREAKRFWKQEGPGNIDLVIEVVNTRPFRCSSFVKGVRVFAIVFQVAREVWFYEANPLVAVMGRYILEPFWIKRLRNIQIVTISKSSKQSLEDYGVRRVSIVPIGHHALKSSEFRKESEPTLLFIGRLTANKRPGDVIRAFQEVRRTLPNAKLWIIGDGPQRAKLQKYEVEGVEFLGRLDEAEKYKRLASAHLLLVTSVREGWGMVVTEAAFLGTPSIGYDVDGLRDSLATHGGLSVNPDPHSLARAIIEFFLGELKLTASDGLSDGSILPWSEVASALLRVSRSVVPVE